MGLFTNDLDLEDIADPWQVNEAKRAIRSGWMKDLLHARNCLRETIEDLPRGDQRLVALQTWLAKTNAAIAKVNNQKATAELRAAEQALAEYAVALVEASEGDCDVRDVELLAQRAFDSLRQARSLVANLRKQKYFIPFVQRNQEVISTLEQQIACREATHATEKAELLRAARLRADEKARREEALLARQREELTQRMRELLGCVRQAIRSNALGTAASLLSRYERCDLDEEFGQLVGELAGAQVREAERLKQLIEASCAGGNLDSARQNVELAEALPAAVLSRVFGVDHAMQLSRYRRRAVGSCRRPRVIR